MVFFKRVVSAILGIVRLTRVLKTAHFLRIFRFIMALRMLVQSILHTMKALFWALLLLGLIVYVFGILFAQAAYDYVSDPANPALPPEVQERYERYFESLLKSMLAMFMSITGGVSWEEVITPLMYVSPFWPACFVFFIAFSYLAVLNVVTAASHLCKERYMHFPQCGYILDAPQNAPTFIVIAAIPKQVGALFGSLALGFRKNAGFHPVRPRVPHVNLCA